MSHARAKLETCPDCGTSYLHLHVGSTLFSGHACTRREPLVIDPAPGVQVGRHLGALANTTGRHTDDTGFAPGGVL